MKPFFLRCNAAISFLLALLFLSGCGGHGGGHKASAKETLAAVRKRGHFSGSIASEDRAPLSTEADFVLVGGTSGAATFRQIDQAKPNDVPLALYRADITNVVIDTDGSSDGTGPISFDLVNFSVGSGRKATDKLSFIGRFQWDGSGFRILNGLVGTPAGIQLNFTQKDRLLPTKGSGAFADPHYAGSIELQSGVLEDWNGAIEQNDDAHVHWTFNSKEGNVDFDLVDAGNTLQGEFDGVKWGYSRGDTVQVYVRRDATGSTVGVFKVIDAYATGRASGRITLLKGVDPAAINAGYYEGTLSPTAQGDGAKAQNFGTVPVRFDVASTTGSPFGAVLLTPKSSEPSVAGRVSGVTKTTLAVVDFTGTYSRIDFTKTNKSATEISGKYRAELADGHTIEAGTFTVKKATPSILASSIVGKTLSGKLKAANGETTDATLGTNADAGAYPVTIGFTTPFLGTSPTLRGYAVGDAFAVFAPGGGDFQGVFSGTVKAGVVPTVTGRYAASATVAGTRKAQSGTLTLGAGASANDLKAGLYTGHVTLAGYAFDAVEFRLASGGGTPQGTLFQIARALDTDIVVPIDALPIVSLKANGDSLVLEVKSDRSGSSVQDLTLSGKVSGDRFSGTASLTAGSTATYSGTFDLALSTAPGPTLSGAYQADFVSLGSESPITASGPVTVSGSGLSLGLSTSAKPAGVTIPPIDLLSSGQYAYASKTYTGTLNGKTRTITTVLRLHVLSADEFVGAYDVVTLDGSGPASQDRGTIHAMRGGGGGGSFATGLYSGTLTKDNSTLARPLRLDVLHNSATEGKNGAAIVLTGRTANPNVGGRVVSVSGDNAAVTVTVKEFSALYLRAYFNGTVTGGVFSGTYSLIGVDPAITESGTFTLTLNAHATHPAFTGVWSGTFGGTTASTGTVRIVEVDDEAALTLVAPATYNGYTVSTVVGYSVDGYFAGHASADAGSAFVGDFFAKLNGAGTHYDGSVLYSVAGDTTRNGAFNGDK